MAHRCSASATTRSTRARSAAAATPWSSAATCWCPNAAARSPFPARSFEGRGAGGFFDDLFGDRGGALQRAARRACCRCGAAPANAPQPWLPLHDLQLRYAATPQDLRTGSAATLTIEATADGATAAQMPELQLPAIDGVQVFAEPVQADESFRNGRPRVKLTRKFSLVPARAGHGPVAGRAHGLVGRARRRGAQRQPAGAVVAGRGRRGASAAAAAAPATSTRRRARRRSRRPPAAPTAAGCWRRCCSRRCGCSPWSGRCSTARVPRRRRRRAPRPTPAHGRPDARRVEPETRARHRRFRRSRRQPVRDGASARRDLDERHRAPRRPAASATHWPRCNARAGAAAMASPRAARCATRSPRARAGV